MEFHRIYFKGLGTRAIFNQLVRALKEEDLLFSGLLKDWQ